MMQLIVRLLDTLFPSRALLLDLEERIDSIEWRLSCLEARAAQEAFLKLPLESECAEGIPHHCRHSH